MGIPAISAGPSSGTETCSPASGPSVGVCSSSVGAGSHNATSASAARWSNGAHASPVDLHLLGSAG